MIIIVEGIDRVGKTTLVNKIADSCQIKPFVDSYLQFSFLQLEKDDNHKISSIGFKHVYSNREDIIANTEKINSLINFFEQYSDKIDNILLDRFHLSEYVYGGVDRNYLSTEVFNLFDERLAKLGAIIIYVEPTDLEWSSKQHGCNLKEHLDFFEYALGKSKCEIIRCNFNTLDDVVLEIKGRLER